MADYQILDVHIEYPTWKDPIRNLLISVAIQSSPGRYKAYQRIMSFKYLSEEGISYVAANGSKMHESQAKILFKQISGRLKYEG
jgi:hypothetical protein